MTVSADTALLPPGMGDLLPPDATLEAEASEKLIELLGQRGFDRVKPPLLEFEESLLAGPGAALAAQTFRLMDPASQRMLGLRSDMTPQVARIAASRLRKTARPLRLCYAGQVLTVRGGQLRPERQFAQVGAEIIGAPSPLADAEAALAALEGLQALGLAGLSIDLNLPTLVSTLARDAGLSGETLSALRAALERKDPTAVSQLEAELGGELASRIRGLLGATGPAEAALNGLEKLGFSGEAADQVAALATLARRILAALPGLPVTIDPVEYRGFEYQAGTAFTVFAAGVRGELGRGGRYVTPGGEPATGFTLFMDTIRRALPRPERRPRILLPVGTGFAQARNLRAAGWVTVESHEDGTDTAAEARRQGCGHVLTTEGPKAISKGE